MKFLIWAMTLLIATSALADETPDVRDTLREAFALGETDPVAARAMLAEVVESHGQLAPGLHAAMAKLSLKQGNPAQADADVKAGLAALGPDGNRETRQMLISMRATVANAAGDGERARQLAMLATSMARKIDDDGLVVRALRKEAQYLQETSPEKARTLLQEARGLADGDADAITAIDEALQALPEAEAEPSSSMSIASSSSPDAVSVLGLQGRELLLLALPVMFVALLIVAVRRKPIAIANHATWDVLKPAAWAIVPLYGQFNLLGWRRALVRQTDAPPEAVGHGAEGVVAFLSVWGLPLAFFVTTVIVDDVAPDHLVSLVVEVLAIVALGATFLVAPLLHHLRDADVSLLRRPLRVIRLVTRHPLQSLALLAHFLIADLVIVVGNMWWFFGGTIASTLAVVHQAEALRRFAVDVAQRERRAAEPRSAAPASGNPAVAPATHHD